MSKKLFKNWWMLLISGILFTIFGILCIASPGLGLLSTGMFIGIIMLIAGITITSFALTFTGHEGWGWRLVEGLIDIFFGIILLWNPGVTALAIPMVIAFWAIFRGVMLFVDSFSYKKLGMSDWWGFLLLGVIAVIFGFFMFRYLGATAIATGWMIGVIMLSMGISAIYYSIKMSKVTVDTPDEWAKKLVDAYNRLKSKQQ